VKLGAVAARTWPAPCSIVIEEEPMPMRLRGVLAIALLAASTSVLAAAAIQLPAVQININGVAVEPSKFTLIYDPAVSPTFEMFGDGSVKIGEQDVGFNFSANGNTDPFFNWSIGLSSFSTNPFTVTVLFGVPAVGGPYDRVTVSDLVATLAGPNAKTTSMSTSALLSTGGPLSTVGSWVLADCASSPCNYVSNVVPVASDFYTLMGAGAQFTLEGGAATAQVVHSAVLTGKLTLDLTPSQVPEPAALLLVASALAAMTIVLRSQRAPALFRSGRKT
jgi:hypothetical protein